MITFGGTTGQDSFEATTTDASGSVVWKMEIPVNSVTMITLHIIGTQSDGTDRYYRRSTDCVYRETGAAYLVSITEVNAGASDSFFYSSSTASITRSTTGGEYRLTAVGVAAETWKWRGRVEYTVLRA